MSENFKTFFRTEIFSSKEKALFIPESKDKLKTKVENRKGYLVTKRIMDVIFSLVALIVLFPFMLLVSLVIIIDDPGASPIFTQTRVGRNGKEFKFYKFRSMYADAEAQKAELMNLNEMDGPVFKIKEDPRITRIGKFLRKTSIDELPQLINIIKGEMSIVGPRPALPNETKEYDNYTQARLLITPGLTCYWQIQPNRNDMSFEEWIELDIKYIKERNLLVDFKIILATFRAVLGFHGV